MTTSHSLTPTPIRLTSTWEDPSRPQDLRLDAGMMRGIWQEGMVFFLRLLGGAPR